MMGPIPTPVFRGEVAQVVDGDTLDVWVDLAPFDVRTRERLRLEGIDAPDEVAAGRRAAHRELERIAPPRSTVRFTIIGRDRYRRWLAHVEVSIAGEAVDAATWLLEHGHARPWT